MGYNQLACSPEVVATVQWRLRLLVKDGSYRVLGSLPPKALDQTRCAMAMCKSRKLVVSFGVQRKPQLNPSGRKSDFEHALPRVSVGPMEASVSCRAAQKVSTPQHSNDLRSCKQQTILYIEDFPIPHFLALGRWIKSCSWFQYFLQTIPSYRGKLAFQETLFGTLASFLRIPVIKRLIPIQ